jgi:hypothetical protein
MLAQLYRTMLLRTAAAFITINFFAPVGASPVLDFSGAGQPGSLQLIRRTSFPTSIRAPKCQTLFVGQKATDGNVCLGVQDKSVIVEYTSVTDFSYSGVHVWIGVGIPPTTAPGQFPYTSDNAYCEIAEDGTSATCTIPLIDLPETSVCDTEFSIATHAAAGRRGGGVGSAFKVIAILGQCIPPSTLTVLKPLQRHRLRWLRLVPPVSMVQRVQSPRLAY